MSAMDKLFRHLADEHGLLLLDSEKREIADIITDIITDENMSEKLKGKTLMRYPAKAHGKGGQERKFAPLKSRNTTIRIPDVEDSQPYIDACNEAVGRLWARDKGRYRG